MGIPGTKCPTVRSTGTTSVRSALMPIVMKSRASMVLYLVVLDKRSADPGPITPTAYRQRGLNHDLSQQPLPGVMGPGFRQDVSCVCCSSRRYFFAAAARSTKVLPPFILWASGASLIWMTTASASTPRFFTSAWVMSRIMPAFCSSVRPTAMLTVISGIVFSLLLSSWPGLSRPSTFSSIKQDVDARDKPGHDVLPEWLSPRYVMARQDLAHFCDELGFAARELRRAARAPFLVGGDRGSSFGAFDQILDLHLATRFFIRALDDDAGRVAAVGIFQLVAHVLGIAEISLGADAGGAQARNHLLVIGDAVAVEHGNDDGTEFGPRVELAEQR